jgi:DNA-binding NtrC family response regulator
VSGELPVPFNAGNLEILFDLHDIQHVAAATPEAARNLATSETLGAVVQDMNFHRSDTTGSDGIDLFHEIRDLQPDLPVLLMTAWASLETAVALVKEGAADYIEKPWNDEKLVATVKNMVRLRTLELENQRLRSELRDSRAALASSHDLCDLVYRSEAMHRVVSLAVTVAPSNAPVLITGPNGSGKERLAEIIHANSSRLKGPLVRVNVGAIPEDLMESELFGAEAGAYTGIRNRRIGHFESADGGTLFLDEIDALSLAGQVKLLRVVQSGEFQRLGSSQTRRADVRIISATNADLASAIGEQVFREDLYFRLNVVELKLPSLAERQEDILVLADYFLGKFSEKEQADQLQLNSEARIALLRHNWPGNVRELENRLQRACLVNQGGVVSSQDLDLAPTPVHGSLDLPTELSTDDTMERARLVQALSEADGVVARAAEELGVSRQALYRKMSRLGIELERRPR